MVDINSAALARNGGEDEHPASDSTNVIPFPRRNASLEETIRVIREFVMPAVEKISKGNPEKKIWQAGGPWK